jgi:PAS domain S-box-containing protein
VTTLCLEKLTLENEPIHFISQIIDITHNKEIEKANKLLMEETNKIKEGQLHKAKNMYRLLADNMIDLICIHHLDGTLEYVSPSIYEIFGYNSKEVIGKKANYFVHPEDDKNLSRCLDNIVKEKGSTTAKVRFRKKNGKYLWCEIKGNLVKENGIPHSFHTSTRDISQSKNAEMAIEKTLQRERKLNELRANLVSTISHEFRTPMTTIRSSAELIALYLKNQPIENQELVQKRIATITGEIDRIITLMNTLLVISKDDLGKTTFTPSVLDLMKTCTNVIEICEFDQKDHRKVQLTVEGANFLVFADKNLMEYIFFNLLSNAFKYSKDSGQSVDLKITKTHDTITVIITDYGIGIPEADQDKLFNTFFRASNTHGIQGTGLGLYIVKTFTDRNRGTISLKSTLGKGTSVKVQFPIALNK